MTELDDEENWAQSDESVEEDSDSNAAMAESSLDRLACALGGKTMLPIVMAQVQTMLQSPDWKMRYAGLMAVSAVGEGCSKQMEPLLTQIVDPILGFLKDPHPQVRYAACNAIGQMATDFAPGYEKKFHSKILPALICLLEDHSCPRVQAHAGAALVNFCEECPRDILKNYADALLGNLQTCFTIKLKELVEQSKKLVLEQLVTTVASVANTFSTTFVILLMVSPSRASGGSNSIQEAIAKSWSHLTSDSGSASAAMRRSFLIMFHNATLSFGLSSTHRRRCGMISAEEDRTPS